MKDPDHILERYQLHDFVFVDVGAKGRLEYCTELAAETHMYGFEPNPQEYRQLLEHYRQHPFKSLQLREEGLSDHPGEAEFRITKHHAMSSLLEPDLANYAMHFGAYPEYRHWENSVQPDKTIRIALQTADTYFAGLNSGIDYMKLDTQGSELLILQGARKLLEERRVAVLKVEVSTVPIYKDQAVFSDIDQFLRGRGFILVDFISYRDDHEPLFASDGHRAHYAPCGDALYILSPEKDTADLLIRKSLLLYWQGYRSLADHLARQAGAGPQEIAVLHRLRSVRHRPFHRRLLKGLTPPFLLRLFKYA